MKKLNITKEQFEKSRYFKNKYGKLEYVSESGKVFKTDKGKVLMFAKESYDRDYAKEKFFGVLTDELGLSQDEIEELADEWDEDYDTMNVIMLKLLDGKPLDRREQIQTAFYLCDKLENHF